MTEEIKVDPVLLTADDLVAIQGVIDLATRRGAFHAAEISTVGKIFDKLKVFNEYIAKSVAEQKVEAE
jgi:hypothetical protein